MFTEGQKARIQKAVEIMLSELEEEWSKRKGREVVWDTEPRQLTLEASLTFKDHPLRIFSKPVVDLC